MLVCFGKTKLTETGVCDCQRRLQTSKDNSLSNNVINRLYKRPCSKQTNNSAQYGKEYECYGTSYMMRHNRHKELTRFEGPDFREHILNSVT